MRETYRVFIEERKRKPRDTQLTVGPEIPDTFWEMGRHYFWAYTNEVEGYVTYTDQKPASWS